MTEFVSTPALRFNVLSTGSPFKDVTEGHIGSVATSTGSTGTISVHCSLSTHNLTPIARVRVARRKNDEECDNVDDGGAEQEPGCRCGSSGLDRQGSRWFWSGFSFRHTVSSENRLGLVEGGSGVGVGAGRDGGTGHGK